MPPLVVAFPSLTFRLAFSVSVQPAFVDLNAETGGGHLWIQRWPTMEDALATTKTGIRLRSPSRVETIFRRLAREGRAELIAGPHCTLYFRFDPRPPHPPPAS